MAAFTYNDRLEELLLARIKAEHARVLNEVEQGVPTLETYRERVGYLRALREIVDWYKDAASDLEKG